MTDEEIAALSASHAAPSGGLTDEQMAAAEKSGGAPAAPAPEHVKPEAHATPPPPETNFGAALRRSAIHAGTALKNHALDAVNAVIPAANAVGTLATNALDTAIPGGVYRKARDAVANLVSPGLGDATSAGENKFNAEHPVLEGTSKAVGYLAPSSEASMLARAGDAALETGAKALPPLVGKVLTSRPVTGALGGALAGAGTSGSTALEAGASPMEAWEEAKAGGKWGALMGAGSGAVAEGLHAGGKALASDKVIDAARKRSIRDIGQDITAAEGPKARATAAQQVAEVNDRIFKLTQEDPSLRKVWSGSAEKSLPKIREIKQAIAEPLDRLNKGIDDHTGGGIRLGDIVDGFRAQADEAGQMAKGLPDADRLNHVADQMLRAYGKEKPVFRADQPVKGGSLDGMKAGDAIALLEKQRKADPKAIGAEIDRIRAEASTNSVDLNRRIPTAQFRAEVTNLGKTAEKAMGTIEGTMKHEALDRLYRAGKEIIDKHIDGSGVPTEQISQIRDINNKYFLLSRAEAAIESRGTKEANKPFATLARNPHAALGVGGLPLVAYALQNPHAIPEIASAYALGHAVPKIAKEVNWKLANQPKGDAYRAAIEDLAKAARKSTSRPDFVRAAVTAGLPANQANRIYEAAHPGEKKQEAMAGNP